jgi:transcriptional regulator with XRE-family HTH domain
MKDRIRRIRKDLNMNQTEFGTEIGATQKMVTTYETGVVLPDKPIRMLICQKFNVNESWLETGEGVPYKEGLIPALANALRAMPDVAAALERVLPRLTPQDLANLNELIKHAFPEE